MTKFKKQKLRLPRKAVVRNEQKDELEEFLKIDTITCFNDLDIRRCPNGFTFQTLGDAVVYYRLSFVNGVPEVEESIRISDSLNVSLTYKGILVPLPDMIRNAPNARLTRFSTLENIPNYIKNRAVDFPPSKILK